MIECSACALRCIRAIIGDSALVSRGIRQGAPGLSPRHGAFSQRAFASHAATTRARPANEVLVPGKQPTDIREKRGADLRQDSPVPDQATLQKELLWLGDPVKLADHVHYTLRRNQPEKALELCRLASKDQEVIVSWNHCIDWHMKSGKINAAYKIYNEMKKRRQHPDSYTYVLILRGLAAQAAVASGEERKGLLAKAISLYSSLSSPTSRVQPSIIHTNAALTVCSEAQDLDAMWGIVAKMPQTGPQAADQRTYAIILNGLRHGAFRDSEEEGMHVEQISRSRREAVAEGRKIWADVIRKWRAGDLWIDEKLVVAMGRLLLFSKDAHDWDSVLDLVKQTMDIDRLLAPLGSPDRHVEHIPEEDRPHVDLEVDKDREDYVDTLPMRVFDPISPMSLPKDHTKRLRPTSLAYTEPGNPTLSLLLGACEQLWSVKTAAAYWDHFTKPFKEGGFGLKADLANFHTVLRLYAINRASAKSMLLVTQSMPAAGVTPNPHTFRIAMHVCKRDKNNPSHISHAYRIVRVMEQTLADPDPRTLSQYLSLALATHDAQKILDVLQHLDRFTVMVRSKLSFGLLTSSGYVPHPERVQRDKFESTKLLSEIMDAHQLVFRRGWVPPDAKRAWRMRRQRLGADLERHRGRYDDQELRSRDQSSERTAAEDFDGFRSEFSDHDASEHDPQADKSREDATSFG